MDITSYIAGLSVSMAQSNASSQISMKMLSNALEQTESEGQGIVNLIDSAAPAAPVGAKGHLLDVRA